MHVSHLSLVDFRSWSELELELGPGSTALVGANGQGKTNIVEALGYAATLSSHRVAADAPLVRAGAARAVVRTRVERDGRSTLLELEVNPGKANRARLNRAPLPRAREVLGVLRTVLFAPEDLTLVRGDPSERRRFLDDLLVASAPRYAGVRADYERVLKQRNALLKTAFLASGGRAPRAAAATCAPSTSGTPTWPRSGADLLGARLALVEALRPRVATAYRAVAVGGEGDRGATGLTYRSSLGEALPLQDGVPTRDRDVLAAALLAELARVRPQEVERGVSPGRSAPRRARARAVRPAGEGLRLARRVLVLRAGAAPGVVRAAARRRGEPVLRARRRLRRARRGPARPAGRAGRRRGAGAGDGGGARRRAGGAGGQPVGRRGGHGAACPLTPPDDDDVPRGTPPQPDLRGPDLVRAALASARAAARAKGLQPGAARRPVRREGLRSGSGPDARDPVRFGEMISRLVAERGWEDTTAAASVLANWDRLVGPEIAEHCRPASLTDGELVLVAESSAWATQLRLLTRTMTARLAERVGPGVVTTSSCAVRRRPTGARAPAGSRAADRATRTADRRVTPARTCQPRTVLGTRGTGLWYPTPDGPRRARTG